MVTKISTHTYGLSHIAVAVKNLVVTRNFYQSVFDMEIMYEEKEFVQLTTPGTHDIIVFQNDDKADGNSGGIAHFGFRLREPQMIFELEQRILKAGGKIVDKGEFVPGSPYIFFKDPDGYEIEIWYELIP